MFGPVVTTETHLAHSNNTAEMTAMVEDSNSCIFDSTRVAGA